MPIGAAKNIQNKVDPFANFIDENMLKHAVKHTNECARRDLRKKGKNSDEGVAVDLCKLKDVAGVLFLVGVYRCQHKSLCSLWSHGPSGRAIFSASFDRNRFEIL